MNARVFGGLARSTEGWTHDLNFEACDGAVDPRITTTAGANRTRVNGAGNVVAASGARVDHSPLGRTNYSPNNSWVGAVAGAPGTLPDLWAWFTSTGLSREIVGVGMEGGRRYMDLRIYGTATSGGALVLYTSQIAALTGQTWTTSMYIRVVAGTAAPLAYYLNIAEYTSGGAYIRESFSAPLTLATSGPLENARQAFTNTLSGGGTVANLGAQLYMIVSNGAVVDVTLRLAVQQTERAAAASADIFTFGSAVTVYDSKGLLQEPDNVSGVSNASTTGAVVGTPGTLPTYWARDKSAGQNIEVVAIGVENGLAYVDLRFWSAANDRGYVGVLFEPYATAAATPGQARYASLHVKHVGGTLTATHLLIHRATNAASAVTADTSVAFTPPASSANLLTSRYGIGQTMPALTAFVLPIYVAGLTVGPAFDYTLRFALPNVGLGSFVQSAVASSGTPLTATPAPHFLSGSNFSSYFTPQGTYLIEFTPYALTNNEVYWGIGQASVFNNSMYLVNSAGSLYLIVYSAGVNTAALDLGVLVAGTRYKVGISYQAGEIAARVNGGTERVSSGAMPAVIDTEGLLTTPWNGGSSYPAAHMHRRRFRPYPSRGQLYQLTA